VEDDFERGSDRVHKSRNVTLQVSTPASNTDERWRVRKIENDDAK